MDVVLQDHNMISKVIASDNPLIELLTDNKLFNVDSVSNRVYLPASGSLAQDLGLSAHNGGPLASYEEGVKGYLENLVKGNPTLWSAAQSGDSSALSFFAKQVENFDNVLTAAFREGAIFTNNGALAAGAADGANRTFFHNVAQWAAQYADKVDAVAELRSALGDDPASLFAAFSNGSQINDLLQFGQNASALNSVKNGAIAVATGTDGNPIVPAEVQAYLDASGIKMPAYAASAALNSAVQAEIAENAAEGQFLASSTGQASGGSSSGASGIAADLAEAAAETSSTVAADAAQGASTIRLGSIAVGTLKVVGAAGLAYDVLTSSAEAQEQIQSGNNADAARTMTDLAARLYVGLEGAGAGAEAGAVLGAAVFSETGPGAIVAGLVGGVAGGLAGAIGGQDAVNTLWTTGRQIIDLITGNSANTSAAPDPQVMDLYGSLVGQGVPADLASRFTSLVREQYQQQDQTDPGLTLNSFTQGMVNSVQDNQSAAVTQGQGPTVTFTLQQPNSRGTAVPGQQSNVNVYDANGNAQASVTRNADGSAAAASYNDNGDVAQSAYLSKDAGTLATSTAGVDGSQHLFALSTDTVGNATNGQLQLDSQGKFAFQQIIDTSPSGQIADTISGNGATASLSNATISLAPNSSATVGGQNNVVNLQANGNDQLTVSGQGQTVNGDSGNNGVNVINDYSFATVNGGGHIGLINNYQTLMLGNGGSIVTTAAGVQNDTITGSGETIDAQGSINSSNVYGNNDTLNLAANSGSGIGLIGTGDTVNGATGAYIPVYEAGASATVNGAASVVLDASGQSLMLGNGGSIVTTAAGVQNDTITGSGETIDAQGSINSSNVYGNNDTLNLAANSGSGIGLIGTGDTVNGATGAYIPVYEAGAGATVNGAASVVLDASGQSLTLGSAGATVTAAAGVTGEAINGSGETIIFGANTSGNVFGSGDGVSVSAGDSLGAYGGGNTINAGADTLVVAGNTNGNFDSINASNDAQGGTVANGQGTGIFLNGNSQANVTGSGDTVNLQGNSSDTLGISGQGQTVTGDSGNDVVNLSGTGTSATVDGGGYVGLVGNNESLTLGNSGSSVLTAPGVQNETVNGSGDTISLAPNTGMTVNGSSDNINGFSGNDSINIYGQYDHFSGNSDNVNFEGNSTGDTEAGANDGYFSNGAYAGSSNGSGGFDPGGADPGGDSDFGDDDPLVLNLQGGDVQTVDVTQSPARFDMENDGSTVRTGWGTAGEGYLVNTASGRNAVSDAADLVPSFAALQALDTNHDGQLNASDAGWSSLRVWVDATGTADFQQGSLLSLDAMGIASIDLNASPDYREQNGNTILADSSFTRTDGSNGDIEDVAFRYAKDTPASGQTLPSSSATAAAATNAAQLVSAMATFDVSSAADTMTQPSQPSAQVGMAVDPSVAQPHRIAA